MADVKAEVLITLLAQVDALFLPKRDPRAANYGSRCSAMFNYQSHGVSWTTAKVGALGRTTQRQLERMVETLVAQKQVRRIGRYQLALTDRGEDDARAWAGLPRVHESAELLRQLVEHRTDPRGCDYLGKQWMPETVYAGVEWGDNANRGKLLALEERMLPFLVRGLVESAATLFGHVYYAPTAAALTWSCPKPEPREPMEEELFTLWCHALKAAVGNAPIDPHCREIGVLPLPASMLPRGRKLT